MFLFFIEKNYENLLSLTRFSTIFTFRLHLNLSCTTRRVVGLPIILLVGYIISQLQPKINARCLNLESLECTGKASADLSLSCPNITYNSQDERTKNEDMDPTAYTPGVRMETVGRRKLCPQCVVNTYTVLSVTLWILLHGLVFSSFIHSFILINNRICYKSI